MNTESGLFIAFEALDGSGSSTQARLLDLYLSKKGYKVLITKEPTNNIVGGLIRGQLTHDWHTSMECLQLLFAADRAHHLEREIVPALNNGGVVITDRYFFSTIAFGALDCDTSWLKHINAPFKIPDVTIMLKVPPEVCVQRIRETRFGFELFEDADKLKKIWKNYKRIATEFPNVFILDGTESREEISAKVREIVEMKIREKRILKNLNFYKYQPIKRRRVRTSN